MEKPHTKYIGHPSFTFEVLQLFRRSPIWSNDVWPKTIRFLYLLWCIQISNMKFTNHIVLSLSVYKRMCRTPRTRNYSRHHNHIACISPCKELQQHRLRLQCQCGWLDFGVSVTSRSCMISSWNSAMKRSIEQTWKKYRIKSGIFMVNS